MMPSVDSGVAAHVHGREAHLAPFPWVMLTIDPVNRSRCQQRSHALTECEIGTAERLMTVPVSWLRRVIGTLIDLASSATGPAAVKRCARANPEHPSTPSGSPA